MPAALVSVQETISSQLGPLIVTTKALPLPPEPPEPAVTVPFNVADEPAQIIWSGPASTTGLLQGGVGQLTE